MAKADQAASVPADDASFTPASHLTGRHKVGDPDLAAKLRRAVEGEVKFDAFTRGRYSTDASIYQIEPVGVVVPKTQDDVQAAIEVAGEAGVPVLPRGGGTSQCGQTVGEAVVIDVSRHLNKVVELDVENRTAWVEPGIVLDHLNAQLKSHDLWFPIDVSTASRATIGGMTGNNSCGSRSIRYGTMRDNVRAIDAFLADGTAMRFGELSDNEPVAGLSDQQRTLVDGMLALGRTEADEIRAKFPDVMRRVGGYNIDALLPGGAPKGAWAEHTVARPQTHPNLAHLLVGSEGTLAVSSRIQIDLQPVPKQKVLGVCHFPTFYQAMESAQHIVKLGPAAVELIDRTMIELSRGIPLFRPTLEQFVRGEPDALLLIEFAGDTLEPQMKKLKQLGELMGDLGFPDAVVEAIDPDFQKAIMEVRKSGLNIMMSMKGDGKPVSFIEDCAVPLENLADYTSRLTDVFHKHGTEGTWYAHASNGCLHVRPVLNLKQEMDVKKMRAIAEEAFAMVREYKASHSGEHGDGLVRSEFHEAMFGPRMVRNFEQVKDTFDPKGILNPGKIVRPPRMDDRALFRFKPGYQVDPMETALDWSEWGGLGGAVEMCNNNGSCRKRDAAVMCPSYRATGDEKDVTRGRANSLRLAISGQLGPDALVSDAMADTMKLCVGCKGCKRECPTGVDMARMKTEFLYHYNKRHGLKLRDKLVAHLPRYAPLAGKLAPLMNLRDRIPGVAKLSEWLMGLSAKRTLPAWRTDFFRDAELAPIAEESTETGREVVFLADTFNRYFERENLDAALKVLRAGGYTVHLARPADGDQDAGRPLCCGRTYLAAGLVDEARQEAHRMLKALKPFVERGVPVIGLEPSCLFTLKDEFKALWPGEESDALAARAVLFEEFLEHEVSTGRLSLPLKGLAQKKALLHGHCHQKAFAAVGAVEKALKLVPELEVEVVESSCCGMAGAFGYQAETYDVSLKMAEASLLPAVRAADQDTLIVADGTSCRHQIGDGTGRAPRHVARVLADALDGSAEAVNG